MTNALFDCRKNVERASDFMDGQLSLADRLVAWAHTTFCSDCRLHVRQLRTTVGVLRRVDGVEPPSLSTSAKARLLDELRKR